MKLKHVKLLKMEYVTVCVGFLALLLILMITYTYQNGVVWVQRQVFPIEFTVAYEKGIECLKEVAKPSIVIVLACSFIFLLQNFFWHSGIPSKDKRRNQWFRRILFLLFILLSTIWMWYGMEKSGICFESMDEENLKVVKTGGEMWVYISNLIIGSIVYWVVTLKWWRY